MFSAPLAETERFGPQDPRLATTLNTLGEVERAQGKYAEAESLLRRALAIREEALGSHHPDGAQGLESYAVVLR